MLTHEFILVGSDPINKADLSGGKPDSLGVGGGSAAFMPLHWTHRLARLPLVGGGKLA
jgi:hypothetical protein